MKRSSLLLSLFEAKNYLKSAFYDKFQNKIVPKSDAIELNSNIFEKAFKTIQNLSNEISMDSNILEDAKANGLFTVINNAILGVGGTLYNVLNAIDIINLSSKDDSWFVGDPTEVNLYSIHKLVWAYLDVIEEELMNTDKNYDRDKAFGFIIPLKLKIIQTSPKLVTNDMLAISQEEGLNNIALKLQQAKKSGNTKTSRIIQSQLENIFFKNGKKMQPDFKNIFTSLLGFNLSGTPDCSDMYLDAIFNPQILKIAKLPSVRDVVQKVIIDPRTHMINSCMQVEFGDSELLVQDTSVFSNVLKAVIPYTTLPDTISKGFGTKAAELAKNIKNKLVNGAISLTEGIKKKLNNALSFFTSFQSEDGFCNWMCKSAEDGGILSIQSEIQSLLSENGLKGNIPDKDLKDLTDILAFIEALNIKIKYCEFTEQSKSKKDLQNHKPVTNEREPYSKNKDLNTTLSTNDTFSEATNDTLSNLDGFQTGRSTNSSFSDNDYSTRRSVIFTDKPKSLTTTNHKGNLDNKTTDKKPTIFGKEKPLLKNIGL